MPPDDVGMTVQDMERDDALDLFSERLTRLELVIKALVLHSGFTEAELISLLTPKP